MSPNTAAGPFWLSLTAFVAGPDILAVAYYVWFFAIMVGLVMRWILDCCYNIILGALFTFVWLAGPILYLVATILIYTEIDYMSNLSAGLLWPVSMVVATILQWCLKYGLVARVWQARRRGLAPDYEPPLRCEMV